ncbi:MAG: MAPEG family protein [Sphingomonadales bacterium]
MTVIPWGAFALILGLALIMVGLGIVYAYSKGAWEYAPGAKILKNFMLSAYACLVLGIALIVAGALTGGLPTPVAGRALPVSLYYGMALGLLLVILTYNVLHHRVRVMTAPGSQGEDEKSGRVTRVHANFTEYVPTGLALLVMVELSGAPAIMVHFGGGLLVLARYLHAYGYTRHPMASFGRIVGIQSTILAISFMTATAFYYLVLCRVL